ncbi:MAG TPA: CoA transferase [Caulobacteraceae bacterium]|jgi:crotonobetainyl-CoA:carnitine CoA-transferase CaiB-like acyl-CoA transferase
MNGVLAGIRVLDFGRYIAGPYCAALLADFGADVIRIEKRSGGEDRFQAPLTPSQEGGLLMQMNRNKRGMTLDPAKPAGQEVVRRLVASADVVVANLPPSGFPALKLDYDSLKAVKPDIILTMVTAYGRGGPYSDRVGFDGIGQVMSGAAYMTADAEGGRPHRFQAPWVDFGTALHCAYGTAMALMARQQTGRGQVVEGSLLATALTVGNGLLIEQSVLGLDRIPTGNRGQTAAPVDIFRTQDGWILVQVVGDPLYRRWAQLMGEEIWSTDPRFKDDISRGANSEAISERMSQWCAERSSATALDVLGKALIPAGPVLKPLQTLDDPHVQAMGFFQPVDYPGLPSPAPIARGPVTLSDTPGSIRSRAPTLGEHTDSILSELGYDASAIAALRDGAVI